MTTKITTRQFEIIEAAGKILSSSGVRGLTIKNLAKEMNFSEGAIYRHFSSKEDIIVAMLEYLAENMENRYSKVILPNMTPIEKFETIFKDQFDFFNNHSNFVTAIFSDGLMEESQRINEAIQKIMQVKVKHLLPIIKEGQQCGQFTNAINSTEMIHIVMGSIRLQMFKWRVAHFEFDIIQHGNGMVQAILSLIKAK